MPDTPPPTGPSVLPPGWAEWLTADPKRKLYFDAEVPEGRDVADVSVAEIIDVLSHFDGEYAINAVRSLPVHKRMEMMEMVEAPFLDGHHRPCFVDPTVPCSSSACEVHRWAK